MLHKNIQDAKSGLEEDVDIQTIRSLFADQYNNENAHKFFSAKEGLFLDDDLKDANSKEFKEALHAFEGFYNNKKFAPEWRILAAFTVFQLFVRSIPTSSLPLEHPHIKKCMNWCNKVINFNKLDNELSIANKIPVHQWLAELYERRGTSQTKQKNKITDSTNKLIQLAIFHYEELAKLVTKSITTKYREISITYSQVATKRKEYLPRNATLADKDTQALIQAYRREIEFHTNVPENRKTLYEPTKEAMENKSFEEKSSVWDFAEDLDAQRVSSIAMSTLGKLYARTPEGEGKRPNFQRAIIWFDKASKDRHYTFSNVSLDKALKLSDLKEAGEALKNLTLEERKKRILEALRAYTNRLKLSLFGHNHDGRARAIINAIIKAETLKQIGDILVNQESSLEQLVVPSKKVIPTDLIEPRFSQADQIKNKPKSNQYLEKSGYYKAIKSAIETLEDLSMYTDNPVYVHGDNTMTL